MAVVDNVQRKANHPKDDLPVRPNHDFKMEELILPDENGILFDRNRNMLDFKVKLPVKISRNNVKIIGYLIGTDATISTYEHH